MLSRVCDCSVCEVYVHKYQDTPVTASRKDLVPGAAAPQRIPWVPPVEDHVPKTNQEGLGFHVHLRRGVLERKTHLSQLLTTAHHPLRQADGLSRTVSLPSASGPTKRPAGRGGDDAEGPEEEIVS